MEVDLLELLHGRNSDGQVDGQDQAGVSTDCDVYK